MTEPVKIFIHIAKSGGTSITHSILNGGNYHQNGDVIYWHADPTKEEIRKADICLGHGHFGIHQYFNRPCVYLSTVRDPADRIISLFYQYVSLGKEEYVAPNKLHTIRDKLCSIGVLEEATQVLSGLPRKSVIPRFSDLMKAQKNIYQYFSFICCLEDLDSYWDLLNKKFNWKWSEDQSHHFVNHGTKRPKLYEIDPRILDTIRKIHCLDYELYKFVKEKQERINHKVLSETII